MHVLQAYLRVLSSLSARWGQYDTQVGKSIDEAELLSPKLLYDGICQLIIPSRHMGFIELFIPSQPSRLNFIASLINADLVLY